LSQWWTPPLRLQVSACSTFLMMWMFLVWQFFCKESIECCPGIVSRYYYYYYHHHHHYILFGHDPASLQWYQHLNHIHSNVFK
jgi:hypothetical protein